MLFTRRSQWLAGTLVIVSFPIFTWLVYAQGTGSDASTHFFYIPIVAAAIFLGDYWGMATAVGAGIVTLWVPSQGATTHNLPDFVVRVCIFYVTAILAARLSGIIRQRMAENASLLEVSRAINSSLRLDEVLQRIAAKAVELTDALGCSILLLDREHKLLVFKASYGLSEDYMARYPVRVSESKLDAAALEVQAGESGERVPACEGKEEVPGAGITTILCVPVMGREQALGVIRIYTKPSYHFSRSERALLSAFANQAAIAIENANLYEDIRQNYRNTVRALTRAIEAKDPATLGHSERATQLALQAGEHLKLSKEQLEALEFGGLLHDIGKIGLDDFVRFPSVAPGASDMISRLHPLIGKSILEPVGFLQPALEVVLHHHEHFDGSGYPEGISGDSIPLLARLFAIADTYDSLTSGNTEQTSLPVMEALQELRRLAGTKLDPTLVEAFAAALARPVERPKRAHTVLGD